MQINQGHLDSTSSELILTGCDGQRNRHINLSLVRYLIPIVLYRSSPDCMSKFRTKHTEGDTVDKKLFRSWSLYCFLVSSYHSLLMGHGLVYISKLEVISCKVYQGSPGFIWTFPHLCFTRFLLPMALHSKQKFSIEIGLAKDLGLQLNSKDLKGKDKIGCDLCMNRLELVSVAHLAVA